MFVPTMKLSAELRDQNNFKKEKKRKE